MDFMFGKGKKKLDRRVRRRIRKTTAVLLLISAITIAAIPVPDAVADEATDGGATVLDVSAEPAYTPDYTENGAYVTSETEKANYPSGIPKLTVDATKPENNPTIYTSAGNLYQFAYVPIASEKGEYRAVILGVGTGAVKNNILDIPPTLEAYVHYSGGKYAAGNKYGNWLYYKERTTHTLTRAAILNEDGSFKSWDGDLQQEGNTEVAKEDNKEYPPVPCEVIGKYTETNETGDKIYKGTYKWTYYTYKYKICTSNEDDEKAKWSSGDVLKYVLCKGKAENYSELENKIFYDLPKDINGSDNEFENYKKFISNYENFDDIPKYSGIESKGSGSTGAIFEQTNTDTQWQNEAIVGCISSQRVVFNETTESYELASDDVAEKLSLLTDTMSVNTLNLPSNLFAIANNVFEGYSKLGTVNFAGTNIKEIGSYAFKDCKSLSKFEVPEGVKMIMEGTFEGCTALGQVTLSSNTEVIGDDAFKNCSALSNITFYDGIEKLGRNVFENTALERVEFPESIQHIGYGTFKNAKNLKGVVLPKTTLNNLGGSIKPIDFSTFEGCTALEYIDVLSTDTAFDISNSNIEAFKKEMGDKFYFIGKDNRECKVYKVAYNNEIAFQDRDTGEYEKVIKDKDETVDLKYVYRVDKDGKLIGIGFDGTGEPTNVEIAGKIGPHSITKIGTRFSESKNKDKLTTLTIPKTITQIEDNAFKGCKNLTKVIFEDSDAIENIGENAFFTQSDSGKPTITPLTFVGKMNDSYLFKYAMSPQHKIAASEDKNAYIDYSSGAPSNLHVRYDKERGGSTLWKVPITSASWWLKADKKATVQDKEDRESAAKEYSDTLSDALKLEDSQRTDDDIDKEIAELLSKGEVSQERLGAVKDAFYAAFDISVPAGVEYIAKNLFSKANDESTQRKNGEIVERAIYGMNSDVSGSDLKFAANSDIRSVTMEGIKELDPYAFYGCKNLETVRMYSSSGGESIGAYAFGQCKELKNVTLPYTTSVMGTVFEPKTENNNTGRASNQDGNQRVARLFAGDENLTSVSFTRDGSLTGENFFCSTKGIIYEGAKGVREKVVECLVARGGEKISGVSIDSNDLEGIKAIYPEAFMGCNKIVSVDLSDVAEGFEKIPEYSFANASILSIFTLPPSYDKTIGNYALKDTALVLLRVPNKNMRLDTKPFYSSELKYNLLQNVNVITPKESRAAEDVNDYPFKESYWTTDPPPKYIITFQDDDGATICKEEVDEGEPVTPPDQSEKEEIKAIWAGVLAKHPGLYFKRWDTNFSPALKNKTAKAVWDVTPPQTWTVRFENDNGKLLVQRTVENGKPAEEPKTPVSFKEKGGTAKDYKFAGWISIPKDDTVGEISMSNITGDVTFMANYDYVGGSSSSGDGSSSGGTSGSSGTSGNNSGRTLYTLAVVNGSGSGSFAAGTDVTISAYEPQAGYEFYNWTSSESDVNFNKMERAVTFKMPAKNLTVTGNYRTKSQSQSGNSIASRLTSGTVTSSAASNKGTTSSNNDSNNSGDNGNSVQVSKPGISDANLASATVNGSTDNFVVKVVEDSQATAAAAEALRNEFGSLENIHYFAMDISLYDETGEQEITDTSGLSVTVTLPIPDELRQYGGNNKVAAVTGGNNLEKLNARFTTVSGVPCAVFTATHFSPYVLYVDTANLSAGAFDSTPKTGDMIHPKWFLAVGLALLSAVLFLKKDKKIRPEMA